MTTSSTDAAAKPNQSKPSAALYDRASRQQYRSVSFVTVSAIRIFLPREHSAKSNICRLQKKKTPKTIAHSTRRSKLISKSRQAQDDSKEASGARASASLKLTESA